jgi:hypothetical protein
MFVMIEWVFIPNQYQSRPFIGRRSCRGLSHLTVTRWGRIPTMGATGSRSQLQNQVSALRYPTSQQPMPHNSLPHSAHKPGEGQRNAWQMTAPATIP